MRMVRKIAVFLCVTLALAPFYFAVLLLFFPVRKRLGPRLIQLYSRICLRIFRIRVECRERHPDHRDGTLLILSNHASFLDIFVLSALFGSVFVSKDEVKYYPILGQVAALSGVIFINRTSARERLRLIRLIASGRVARKISVFPQGTTGTAAMRLPFQRGIFKSVEMNPAIVILPVTLCYENDRELAWRAPETMLAHAKKVFGQREVNVSVVVHDPVTQARIEGMTATEICAAVEKTVLVPLEELCAAET